MERAGGHEFEGKAMQEERGAAFHWPCGAKQSYSP